MTLETTGVLFFDPTQLVRLRAIEALLLAAGEEALGEIARLARIDSSSVVRAGAVAVIARSDAPFARSVLAELAFDPDAPLDVRSRAQAAMAPPSSR